MSRPWSMVRRVVRHVVPFPVNFGLMTIGFLKRRSPLRSFEQILLVFFYVKRYGFFIIIVFA